MNHVSLVGAISQYGVKIAWTEGGKPQTSLTLVMANPGRDGATYRTFIPVLDAGPIPTTVTGENPMDAKVVTEASRRRRKGFR